MACGIIDTPLILLPCPFCGGKANLKISDSPLCNGVIAYVACGECGNKSESFNDWTFDFKTARSEKNGIHKAVAKAVRAWNTRTEKYMNRENIAQEIAQELLDNGALDEGNFCHDADALISYVQQVILEHFKDYMLVRGNVI